MNHEVGVADTGAWRVNPSLVLRSKRSAHRFNFERTRPLFLASELVPLLEPFIQPRVLEEGIGEFLKRFVGYEDRPDLVDQVWATVRQMQDASVLVPAGGDQPRIRPADFRALRTMF